MYFFSKNYIKTKKKSIFFSCENNLFFDIRDYVKFSITRLYFRKYVIFLFLMICHVFFNKIDFTKKYSMFFRKLSIFLKLTIELF